MTNPKTRKTGKASSLQHRQNDSAEDEGSGEMTAMAAPSVQFEMLTPADWMQICDGSSDDEEEGSQTPTPTDNGDDDDADHDELDDESSSAFSLQECLDELHTRRIRRVSTRSRDAEVVGVERVAAGGEIAPPRRCHIDPADEDLINQNRSNKEHERKCKPCQNGFCYCFTSDSGDGGGGCGAAARVAHVRNPRRQQRKSEGSQPSHALAQRTQLPSREQSRQSAPAAAAATLKTAQKAVRPQKASPVRADPLTAISRLRTTSADAPLIHIIQELRDNCVISEVRVNRQKLGTHQRSRSLSAKPSPRKTRNADEQLATSQPNGRSPSKGAYAEASQAHTLKTHAPSAPTLDKIHELAANESFVYGSPLNSSSAKSNDSERAKHKAAGRLLQKRLSSGGAHAQLRLRNFAEPPPKPPRSSLDFNDKASVSTVASTSPSVRNAELIIDDFLRRRGVDVPEIQVNGRHLGKGQDASALRRQDQELTRKSKPITPSETRRPAQCAYPSISDIERLLEGNKAGSRHYGKNMRHTAVGDKPVKEVTIGWKEPPNIEQMLNYDASSAQRKEFVSRGVQAQPQQPLSNIGWQQPTPPRQQIDTVDGTERHNLAANNQPKQTPVKSRFFGNARQPSASHKFILSEHWRNLSSPWQQNKTPPRKSNLKTASRSFLTTSKQKILRLVSPKKDNREAESCRSVAVQTSPPSDELRPYENSSTPQSPPDSYHSAVQTSQQLSSNTTGTSPMQAAHTPVAQRHFNFARQVRSPPKKPTRSTQRRLNFPLSCVSKGCTDSPETAATAPLPKTYRSFNTDLYQDYTASKMGYILGNIRAKLEASDAHAMRTFQEIGRREQQAAGYDCPDGPTRPHITTRQPTPPTPTPPTPPTPTPTPPPQQHYQPQRHTRSVNRRLVEFEQDPIYSEIEEESLHIAGSPAFDNATGIQHLSVEHNPAVLYAQVNKVPKASAKALGQLLHDSLRQRPAADAMGDKPLPPIPANSPRYSASTVFYSSPAHSHASPPPLLPTTLHHCHSLNNIRVMEHNSPPKKHRNLSKSDLSLQRSEIFLENLCRSELIIETSPRATRQRLEKVDNKQQEIANTSYDSVPSEDVAASARYSSLDDSLAYVVPPATSAAECSDSNAGGSNLALSLIAPPHTLNQSTPKKQSPEEERTRSQMFLTKPDGATDAQQATPSPLLNQSNSCPSTPNQPPSLPAEQRYDAVSLDAVNALDESANSNAPTNGRDNNATMSRYQRLKNSLCQSLRKRKDNVRPNVNVAPAAQSSQNALNESGSRNSTFDLDALFALDDDADTSVSEQLAKAVSICRQLPDLEISAEMVEAERLLLYTTLRRQSEARPQSSPSRPDEQPQRFCIDAMRLPIRANASQDLFFNYFYICTFECAGVIGSTQSAECRNGVAIFTDCNMEFGCSALGGPEAAESVVNCQIFMLRLRKVSTLALEPQKRTVKLPALLTPSPTCSSSSSAGSEEIISRFRLHASFTLRAIDFLPFQVACESDYISMRATRIDLAVPLTVHTKSTNLTQQLLLTGRAELRFAQRTHSGYLNVQDAHSMHNWNRRWCAMDAVHLRIWSDESNLSAEPLLCLSLCTSQQALPLAPASRELCARQRSFCLQCVITAAGKPSTDVVEAAAVFFAADTQAEVNAWLAELNIVLSFLRRWLQ